jgi:hypothetical protein
MKIKFGDIVLIDNKKYVYISTRKLKNYYSESIFYDLLSIENKEIETIYYPVSLRDVGCSKIKKSKPLIFKKIGHIDFVYDNNK